MNSEQMTSERTNSGPMNIEQWTDEQQTYEQGQSGVGPMEITYARD